MTAAAHIARVQGKEQGTKYLEHTGGMQRAYSECAECKTLLILYYPVTKQEDLGCILGTTQNIRCSQEGTKHRDQSQSGAVPIALLSLASTTTPTLALEFNGNQTSYLSYLKRLSNHSATSAVPTVWYSKYMKRMQNQNRFPARTEN